MIKLHLNQSSNFVRLAVTSRERCYCSEAGLEIHTAGRAMASTISTARMIAAANAAAFVFFVMLFRPPLVLLRSGLCL